MSIVGLNGQELSSKTKTVKYEVGGIRIDVDSTPDMMLQQALAGAQNMVAQMAMQRSGSQAVAAAEASKVSNPFQLEPAALAVFMLMSREIEHRDRVIEALAKRLDQLDGENSEELLKKAWPQKETEEKKVEKQDDDDSK